MKKRIIMGWYKNVHYKININNQHGVYTGRYTIYITKKEMIKKLKLKKTNTLKDLLKSYSKNYYLQKLNFYNILPEIEIEKVNDRMVMSLSDIVDNSFDEKEIEKTILIHVRLTIDSYDKMYKKNTAILEQEKKLLGERI